MKQLKPVTKFFVIVLSIVTIFLVIAIPIFINAYNSGESPMDFISFSKNNPLPDEKTGQKSILDSLFGSKKEENVNITVAIMGVDKDESLTDTMMVANFNSKTNKIGIISIPRDTKVTMPKDRIAKLKEAKRPVPSSGVMKMNEVHSYGGKKYGNEFAVMQLEDLLGVDIDNYIIVNLEAFRYMVDAIGGVELTVPKGGMKYQDPFQDLYINLKEGTYTLTGAQAEGFVRIRSIYANQDLGRIQAQQTFLKAFVKQALQKETIISNINEYIYAAFNYFKTDFSADDLVSYAKYIKAVDPENMEMAVLPGKATSTGVSYVIQDVEETKLLVERLFYASDESEADESAENISSTGKKIVVLNGGSKSGIAAKYKDTLTDAGFNVEKIGNYSGSRKNNTRIVVTEKGMGNDLITFFADAEIINDASMVRAYDDAVDIMIIIGLDEE